MAKTIVETKVIHTTYVVCSNCGAKHKNQTIAKRKYADVDWYCKNCEPRHNYKPCINCGHTKGSHYRAMHSGKWVYTFCEVHRNLESRCSCTQYEYHSTE